MDLYTILISSVAGFVPALIWLWFWLREDKKNPEPARALVLAFFAGMLAVVISIVLEKATQSFIQASILIPVASKTIAIIFVWVVIEEVVKYLMAFFSSLRKPYNDEPVDPLIYMITVALGFAALENTLYFLTPLQNNGLTASVLLDGNYRFLGAALLHTLASSMVGVALALTFYSRQKRIWALPLGLLAAIIVHFMFNYALAIQNVHILRVSAFVWLGLIGIIIVFEKVKKL